MLDFPMLDRRCLFLAGGATALATLTRHSEQSLRAADALGSASHYEVVDVRRTTVKLPYRPIPARNMDRELPHWRWSEICEVELKSGHVGCGETLLYYTWGVPSDDDIGRVVGQNAMQWMWHDDLGAGLQMALFDAVARTSQVPLHCLLGRQVHARTPLSWWNIDTSGDDMAAECQAALRRGYRSYKTKGRPWFDVREQVEKACAVVPETFKVDMDFNDTLLTAEQGLPILRDLARHPQVDIFESPIPQSDIAGNQQICAATDVHVAMHFGTPSPRTTIREDVCDGFVVGGGASAVCRAGMFCQHAEKPFWLQLVGSGITAAYSLHFGAVLAQATWPAVNCHQLYETELLTTPITLTDGYVSIPTGPGLGYELDRDAMARLAVPRPKSRPEPERLVETVWADGSRLYSASNGQVNFMLTAAQAGKYPYYQAGAHSRLIPNDGSTAWRETYTRARQSGPVSGPPLD